MAWRPLAKAPPRPVALAPKTLSAALSELAGVLETTDRRQTVPPTAPVSRRAVSSAEAFAQHLIPYLGLGIVDLMLQEEPPKLNMRDSSVYGSATSASRSREGASAQQRGGVAKIAVPSSKAAVTTTALPTGLMLRVSDDAFTTAVLQIPLSRIASEATLRKIAFHVTCDAAEATRDPEDTPLNLLPRVPRPSFDDYFPVQPDSPVATSGAAAARASQAPASALAARAWPLSWLQYHAAFSALLLEEVRAALAEGVVVAARAITGVESTVSGSAAMDELGGKDGRDRSRSQLVIDGAAFHCLVGGADGRTDSTGTSGSRRGHRALQFVIHDSSNGSQQRSGYSRPAIVPGQVGALLPRDIVLIQVQGARGAYNLGTGALHTGRAGLFPVMIGIVTTSSDKSASIRVMIPADKARSMSATFTSAAMSGADPRPHGSAPVAVAAAASSSWGGGGEDGNAYLSDPRAFTAKVVRLDSIATALHSYQSVGATAYSPFAGLVLAPSRALRSSPHAPLGHEGAGIAASMDDDGRKAPDFLPPALVASLRARFDASQLQAIFTVVSGGAYRLPFLRVGGAGTTISSSLTQIGPPVRRVDVSRSAGRPSPPPLLPSHVEVTLLVGPPGTGKTRTVLGIISALRAHLRALARERDTLRLRSMVTGTPSTRVPLDRVSPVRESGRRVQAVRVSRPAAVAAAACVSIYPAQRNAATAAADDDDNDVDSEHEEVVVDDDMDWEGEEERGGIYDVPLESSAETSTAASTTFVGYMRAASTAPEGKLSSSDPRKPQISDDSKSAYRVAMPPSAVVAHDKGDVACCYDDDIPNAGDLSDVVADPVLTMPTVAETADSAAVAEEYAEHRPSRQAESDNVIGHAALQGAGRSGTPASSSRACIHEAVDCRRSVTSAASTDEINLVSSGADDDEVNAFGMSKVSSIRRSNSVVDLVVDDSGDDDDVTAHLRAAQARASSPVTETVNFVDANTEAGFEGGATVTGRIKSNMWPLSAMLDDDVAIRKAAVASSDSLLAAHDERGQSFEELIKEEAAPSARDMLRDGASGVCLESQLARERVATEKPTLHATFNNSVLAKRYDTDGDCTDDDAVLALAASSTEQTSSYALPHVTSQLVDQDDESPVHDMHDDVIDDTDIFITANRRRPPLKRWSRLQPRRRYTHSMQLQ